MKQELKEYPKMSLASVVYGNDDPTTANQVTQGLLQQYPNLKGIISPASVGIAVAGAVLDSPKYRGKVLLTGLGTPNEMKKFVVDGTVKSFVLWNPADLGYLAAYAAIELASGKITGAQGQTLTAGKLGSFTVGADNKIVLGLWVPRTSSTSCDKAVFVDYAADARVSSDTMLLKIGRFG